VVTASTGGTTTRANAAVFGETVTFTATVSPTAPGVATPTGNMQFSVDNGAVISVPLGQDNLGHTGFASNVALFVTSSLSVTPGGTLHNIVASFVNVDGNFNDSSNVANPLQIQVNGAGTNTAVSLTASSAVYSAPATLVATVTVNGLGSGTPTGTVQFMDTNTGNPIGGPVTLGTNGNPANVASLDISTITPLLDVGTYNVEAVYSGDANFAGSDNTSQPPPTLAITRDGTTTTLKSSDLSAVFTEQVTLTAVVTPTTPGTAIAPNTTVNFLDGTKVIGSGTVAFDAANGVYDATYTTTTFAVGTHLLKAQFLGNADDAASGTATAISQKVAVAPTSIVGITASDSTGDPNGDPTYFGQTATFTATVAANAPATGTPSGTVTFKDNGVAITGGTVSLIGNTALFATSSLAVLTAPHNITAVYNGKLGAYAASTTSPTLQHTVFSALTSVTLTGPAGIVLGSPVPFTATVAVTAPGAGNVVGTVQFKVTDPSTGNLIIASPGQAIVGGVAHWSGWVPGIALGPGSYNVTVSYNPGTSLSFAPSSSTKTLTAGYRTTATISTTAPTGVIVGNPFTLATTVTSGPVTAGGKLVTLPTMTGTVTFVDTISGQPVSPAIPVSALSGNAAGTIQKGTVSFQVTSLPVGNYNIVARYSGDANYAPVTTAAISEGVFTAPASISATLVKAPLGVGSLFTVAVKVYDANGNQILLSTGNATIIEIAGPVGGFTPHTVAFNNKTGMFTFSGLTVSKSSGYTPYTLQITFDNLTTTISFSVTGRVS
jgi:hypothetical protein